MHHRSGGGDSIPYNPAKRNIITVACKTGFPSDPAAGNFISLLDQGSQPHLTNSVKRWLLNHDTLRVQIASK
jgi:hypothetical protein